MPHKLAALVPAEWMLLAMIVGSFVYSTAVYLGMPDFMRLFQ